MFFWLTIPNLDVSVLSSHFDSIWRVTNVGKYRSFQYRLLHRALVLNTHLKKWNITVDDTCTFCQLETETVEHLFFECKYVKDLWGSALEYIQEKYDEVGLAWNVKNVLLNTIHPVVNHVQNFLCLVTKQFIYHSKCQKQKPIFLHLKRIFNSIESMLYVPVNSLFTI